MGAVTEHASKSSEMVHVPRGEILYAVDHGTIWQLVYKIDGDGSDAVHFDHRPFAALYEGATGGSFHDDYRFGAGRQYISNRLKGRRISVEGEPFNQTVEIEN